LNPLNILRRGFSMTLAGGEVVREAGRLKVGDLISVVLAQGELGARVTEVRSRRLLEDLPEAAGPIDQEPALDPEG
jgi:exonuclease VII large subunit